MREIYYSTYSMGMEKINYIKRSCVAFISCPIFGEVKKIEKSFRFCYDNCTCKQGKGETSERKHGVSGMED